MFTRQFLIKFVHDFKIVIKILVSQYIFLYEFLGCNMSLKLNFLHLHLYHLPQNLGAVSKEKDERFHQDIKELEMRCQKSCNTDMIPDCVGGET